jgi:hypothetical protein
VKGKRVQEGGMQLKGVETKNPRVSTLGKGREKRVVWRCGGREKRVVGRERERVEVTQFIDATPHPLEGY